VRVGWASVGGWARSAAGTNDSAAVSAGASTSRGRRRGSISARAARGVRRRRRARQARDRYQAAGLASRDGERERKQEWRNERQKGPGSQRPGLPPEVKRAIAREMDGLSSEGRQQRRGVERALRRVAKRACAGQMSLAGLGADPLMISEG